MTSLNVFDFIPANLHSGIVSGTNTVDLTSYLQQAIDASKIGSGMRPRWKSIFFPVGVYKITDTLYATGTGNPQSFTAASFIGENGNSTVFEYSSFQIGKAAIKYHGGSGVFSMAEVSNIRFIGSGASVGIELSGQCNVDINRCNFELNKVGLLMYNEDAGAFTECCVAHNCNFARECVTAIEYRRLNGDMSFHGSGLQNCTINTNGEPIKIGAGCVVYNAEISVTIWTHNTQETSLIKNDGFPAKIRGTINLEQMGKRVFLGRGNDIYLNGSVYVHNQDYSLGSLQQCSLIQSNSDGSTNLLRLPFSKRIAITTTSTTINLPQSEGGWLISLRIVGTQYDYRYVVVASHEGYGGTGFYKVLAALREFNQAGYGNPVLSVDNQGNLIVTNANYVSKSLNLDFTVHQIGQRFGYHN